MKFKTSWLRVVLAVPLPVLLIIVFAGTGNVAAFRATSSAMAGSSSGMADHTLTAQLPKDSGYQTTLEQHPIIFLIMLLVPLICIFCGARRTEQIGWGLLTVECILLVTTMALYD